jgi:hypothetical protein
MTINGLSTDSRRLSGLAEVLEDDRFLLTY